MDLNKIVVKFQNGDIAKGWTTDFKADKIPFICVHLKNMAKNH